MSTVRMFNSYVFSTLFTQCMLKRGPKNGKTCDILFWWKIIVLERMAEIIIITNDIKWLTVNWKSKSLLRQEYLLIPNRNQSISHPVIKSHINCMIVSMLLAPWHKLFVLCWIQFFDMNYRIDIFNMPDQVLDDASSVIWPSWFILPSYTCHMKRQSKSSRWQRCRSLNQAGFIGDIIISLPET